MITQHQWNHREKDSAATVSEEFCYRLYPVAYSGAQGHYQRIYWEAASICGC